MQQLQIEDCLCDNVDALSEQLEVLGAVSVTWTDQHDDPILEPELGTVPLWPKVVVTALFDDTAIPALSSFLKENAHLQASLSLVPEEDWERTCLSGLTPHQFGERLWICPTWLTPPDPEAITLLLDPGLAFGTGTHPTTHLCLVWLEQADLKQKNLIDYGCGSGILALAALKLGAKHVHAVDIDPQALTATHENALKNQINAAQLSLSAPEKLDKAVDLLIANILLQPLLQLKTHFHHHLLANGTLVVSGLLAEQAPQLIEAYHDLFVYEKTMIQEDWALLIFRKRLEV